MKSILHRWFFWWKWYFPASIDVIVLKRANARTYPRIASHDLFSDLCSLNMGYVSLCTPFNLYWFIIISSPISKWPHIGGKYHNVFTKTHIFWLSTHPTIFPGYVSKSYLPTESKCIMTCWAYKLMIQILLMMIQLDYDSKWFIIMTHPTESN